MVGAFDMGFNLGILCLRLITNGWLSGQKDEKQNAKKQMMKDSYVT